MIDEAPELTMILPVDPNKLPEMWDELKPLLIEACKWSAGERTPEEVGIGICDGTYRLLAFMSEGKIASILVLAVSEYATGNRKLEIVLASGSGVKHWRHFEEELAAYGAKNGCSTIRMIGREGLQRMLPEWKRTSIVLEREIKHG